MPSITIFVRRALLNGKYITEKKNVRNCQMSKRYSLIWHRARAKSATKQHFIGARLFFQLSSSTIIYQGMRQQDPRNHCETVSIKSQSAL